MKNKNPLEKVIEKKICEHAKALGFYVRKFTSPAHRSVPDRLFVYKGTVIFMELKRLGQKPTPAQEVEIQKIRDHGGTVYVVDNVERGQRILDLIVFNS